MIDLQGFFKSIALFSFLLFSSCASFQDLLLLDEGEAYPETPETITNRKLPVIQPSDVLYITVEADDLEGIAAKPFNKEPTTAIAGGGGGANLIELSGYLVDTSGHIEFPVLGKLKMGGLTTAEAQQYIKDQLLPYIKRPIVNIRFLNFKVNIVGEVNGPGVYTTTNERLTIFEALSQAGGISSFGNASNILIIREQNGEREYGRINLKSRDVFNSPYFYLQQNDVLYVEPLETKISQVRDPAQRVFPWVSLGISTITFLIAVLN
ncbi:MAG: polysaccharide biosynthesis/export family protein [Bacteroidota bacterium]